MIAIIIGTVIGIYYAAILSCATYVYLCDGCQQDARWDPDDDYRQMIDRIYVD